MTPLPLPSALQRRVEDAARDFLDAPGLPRIDFTAPAGAPALLKPDSLSWRVMKNPLTLMIGGVAGVILELAEPRVRTGVWDHTSFRSDPVMRMKRTGHAAMVTIYGPADVARAMIAGVSRRHGAISGKTPAGAAYAANDPELLTWVQATAGYGFLEAYRRYARALSPAECDAFFAEGATVAPLYGAERAPRSVLECEALFTRMRGKLERSEIVFEFLEILRQASILPSLARTVQGLAIRAAVAITPDWARDILGLNARYSLPPGGETLLRGVAAAAERVVLASAPPSQACVRLGLGADYLYR